MPHYTGEVATNGGLAAQPAKRYSRWLLILILCGFGAPVAARFAGYVTRAMYLPSITFNEGWNAFYARQAAEGIPLYGRKPDRLVNNYPPLSYHLIAAIAGPSGDVNRVARIVSLIAVAWVAFCAAWLASRFAADRWAGAFAALFCMGWFVFFVPGSVGVDEPQMLAHAVILTGAVLYWVRPDSIPMLIAACIVCCVGGFIKHTQIAFPAAIALDLLWRSRRRFAIWVAVAAAVIAGLGLLTVWMDGPYFLDHLFARRRYSAAAAVAVSGVYLKVFLAALVISVSWCALRIRLAPARFLAAIIVLSTVVGIGLSFGAGVAVNIFYDGVIAMSIVSGWLMSDIAKGLRAGEAKWIPLMLAAPPMLLAAPVIVGLYSAAPPRAELAESERLFREDIAYLKSRPGPAVCTDLLLCSAAGKSFEYDPFFTRQLIATGQLDQRVLADEFARRKYAVIQIDETHTDFDSQVLAAIQAAYHVERKNGGRTFLTPNP
jgi:hypothetical protein